MLPVARSAAAPPVNAKDRAASAYFGFRRQYLVVRGLSLALSCLFYKTGQGKTLKGEPQRVVGARSRRRRCLGAHFTFHPRLLLRFKFQFGKKLTSLVAVASSGRGVFGSPVPSLDPEVATHPTD